MPSRTMIIGHRGARGLFPENTITGFVETIKMGVDALEFDVVISKDKQVLVSHEAWMNPVFCSKPDGTPVENDSKERYNLYQMDYSVIRTFDCGKRKNSEFPLQKAVSEHKPLLSEVLAKTESISKVNYNLEVKTEKDNVYNPAPMEFVELILKEIKKFDLEARLIIKSFDTRILREIRKKAPQISIGLLVENEAGVQANLEHLGFVPKMYCPDFILVNREMVEAAHNKNMLIVPWTVNEAADIKRMLELGVDGIISDYPSKTIEIRDEG